MLYETENEGVGELDQCPICSLQDLYSILHENILSLCKALSSSSHREYLRGKPIGTLSLLSAASFPSPTLPYSPLLPSSSFPLYFPPSLPPSLFLSACLSPKNFMELIFDRK